MVLELLLELRSGGAGGDALTGRESQVLGMLRRGQSTAAIAERLQIAPVTVRRHVSELVRKLGVEDRSELVAGDAMGPGKPDRQRQWQRPRIGRRRARRLGARILNAHWAVRLIVVAVTRRHHSADSLHG